MDFLLPSMKIMDFLLPSVKIMDFLLPSKGMVDFLSPSGRIMDFLLPSMKIIDFLLPLGITFSRPEDAWVDLYIKASSNLTCIEFFTIVSSQSP